MILAWERLFIENFDSKEYSELCIEIINSLPVQVTLMCNHGAERQALKGYVISCCEGNLYIKASNGEMLYLALSYIRKCESSDRAYTLEELNDSFVFPNREQYVQNCSCFVPVWKYLWTPPAWLLDYKEKAESFTKKNRPFCWAHRGGGDYYPENSIEAIISSIQMGADIMELDFRYTKDRRIVLMHWSTLHQTTDWSEKKGKNGLPESDNLSDWTYEELSKLRLKAGRKFREDCITEYKIPTLEEVLKVCDGRAFFIMDKMNPAEEWPSIYKIICETGCYEAFSFAYKMPEDMVDSIRKEMLERFGKTGPYFYARRHAGSLERECISEDEKQKVFREFSVGRDTAIMTNYVQDLVEYIDRNYKEG